MYTMKKRLTGLSKVTVAALVAASLVAPNVASAAPYDIWNGTTKVGNLKDALLNDNKALLLDIVENADKYRYELGGKTYLYSEADAISVANPDLVGTDLETKISTDLASKAEDAPTETAALAVESVSATDATTLEVKFSQELDPTAVVVSNFTLLDKNSSAKVSVTKAVLSADKKVVTLTTNTGLTATTAPYTLLINKNAIPVDNNQIEIAALPTTAPTITGNVVTTDKQVVLSSDVSLTDKGAAAALVTSVIDLTDTTNIDTVAATTVVSNGKLTIDMTTADFFKAGHVYEATIAANTLEDSFGNVNKEAVKYQFTVQANEAAPRMTAVEFFGDKTTPGKIHAIVTFDMAIKDVAGATVNAKLIDKVGFTTTDLTNKTAKYSADDVTTYKDGLKLEANQMLIEEVVAAGTTMKADQMYTLELAAGEVMDTTLSKVQNETTSAEATGVYVDTVVPTLELTKSQLTSATEITLAFSEAVAYTGGSVQISGFDATGAVADIEATVTMSADGTTATLTPKVAGTLFKTDVTATVKYAEGVFKDNAENPIADGSAGTALTGAADKAAPALVKIADGGNTNTLTVTFTENLVANEKATILVNGTEYVYNATAGDGKWNVATNVITVTATGLLNAGDQVSIPAGIAKDAANNETTAIFGTSK